MLDRDGTIIADRHYLSKPDDVELLEHSANGLRLLCSAGFRLVVLSNQSGVGRGLFSLGDLSLVERRLTQLLEPEGVHVDGFYYCPHTPEDACACRKPRTGLVTEAAKDFGFDPHDAWVIGDKTSDIELAKTCGARSILVRTGYGMQHEARQTNADHIFDDLSQAAAFLISEYPSSLC